MATVETWGRLIAYTCGETVNVPCGEVASLPYGVQRAATGAVNAAKAFGKRADELNETLEQSNMYQLSAVEVAFGNTVTALDKLLANLG